MNFYLILHIVQNEVKVHTLCTLRLGARLMQRLELAQVPEGSLLHLD